MNNVLWVIQENLINGDDLDKLIGFVDSLGISKKLIKVIPFDDTPPEIEWNGPVFFYGSTTLAKNVVIAGKWNPGVFFSQEGFLFKNLKAGYGNQLLNHDSQVMPIRDLLVENRNKDELVFVRPAADMKEFTGSVMEFSEILEWKTGLESSNGPLSLDTLVQVASPKNLGREWRTIVVDKKVIAASQYKKYGRLNTKDEVPKSVIEYANTVAQLYQPDLVFVLDVCEWNDSYFVVETNCVNCAGWYWCDYYSIVKSITDFISENYPELSSKNK